MRGTIAVRRFAVTIGLCAALAITGPGASWAKDPPPRATPEGLELKKETNTRLVYMKPGATFSQYKRVAILDCYVEFSKDWLRGYNNEQRDPSRRIKDSDIERAKTSLSAQFKKVFTDELQGRGGYQVTDTAAPDVLALRPALINIQVSAPDLMAPGRSATYVQSAGQMTLYLELWDSAQNTLLARVIDAQADTQAFTQRSSSVTNQAAAQQILRSWAVELHGALDAARGQP
jgi:hypothetical protein